MAKRLSTSTPEHHPTNQPKRSLLRYQSINMSPWYVDLESWATGREKGPCLWRITLSRLTATALRSPWLDIHKAVHC